MKQKRKFSPREYVKNNPRKANIIKKAVERGAKQYEQTFRKLASV